MRSTVSLSTLLELATLPSKSNVLLMSALRMSCHVGGLAPARFLKSLKRGYSALEGVSGGEIR